MSAMRSVATRAQDVSNPIATATVLVSDRERDSTVVPVLQPNRIASGKLVLSKRVISPDRRDCVGPNVMTSCAGLVRDLETEADSAMSDRLTRSTHKGHSPTS